MSDSKQLKERIDELKRELGAVIITHNYQQSEIQHPEVQVLIHPECHPEVISLADAILSTSQMLRYVKTSSYQNSLLAPRRDYFIAYTWRTQTSPST